MKFTEAVKFHPWVGSSYGASSIWKIPILVIGDSHYDCGQTLTASITNEVVSGQSHTHHFFRSISKALLGRDNFTDRESFTFWNSIAFYNFVQESAGPDGSSQPTSEMYERSVPGFREVLAKLKPRCVVVVCVRTWNRLPDGSELEKQGPDLQLGNVKRSSWLYSIGDGEFAHTSRIPHPSMRRKWNFQDWHPWVKLAIENAMSVVPVQTP